jgi:hypothetical protein
MSTTNHELAEVCQKHGISLVGVFSKNDLPKKHQEGGYIINLSDSHDESGNPLPGTHWVAFWVERNKCCYFDSFGCPPPVTVQRFLKRYGRYPYCALVLQNMNSTVCGWYCIDFLVHMCSHRGGGTVDKRFTAFLDQWSYNPEHNRRLLLDHLAVHGIQTS